jgi:RimJ/RimL family protein N-acetyltransferase
MSISIRPDEHAANRSTDSAPALRKRSRRLCRHVCERGGDALAGREQAALQGRGLAQHGHDGWPLAVERASGEFVGRIGPWYPEGWPGFEVGWMLRREFWGRGYATEAGRAAIHYAFTKLDQPRVISLIRPDNVNSIRVAERVGEQLDSETEVMGYRTLIYAIHRT